MHAYMFIRIHARISTNHCVKQLCCTLLFHRAVTCIYFSVHFIFKFYILFISLFVFLIFFHLIVFCETHQSYPPKLSKAIRESYTYVKVCCILQTEKKQKMWYLFIQIHQEKGCNLTHSLAIADFCVVH